MGHFTSANVTVGDQAFLGATSATFGWDQPLQFVTVDFIDSHGGVIGSCSVVGSLVCSAARVFGQGESDTRRTSTPSSDRVTPGRKPSNRFR